MSFNLGPFTIDVAVLIAFFSGIALGFIIMALWYLVAVLASLNKGMKTHKSEIKDIDEAEIKWLIKDAHELFKDKEKREKTGYGKHLYQISLDLANDIASKFYPNSKYPYLELTIDETLMLLRYVSIRFDELLNKPILKMFKGMTLRRIMTLNDTKHKFDENIIVKSSSKLKITEVFKKSLMVLNVVNPVYWFRKLLMDNVLNIIFIKLGLVIISLTGEETYKIYSKKVFDEDKEIESDIEGLYDEIEQAIKEENKNEKKK
ncbi:MAG: hypothetical protein WC907_05530 [Acholeplasmataceae bacterium]